MFYWVSCFRSFSFFQVFRVVSVSSRRKRPFASVRLRSAPFGRIVEVTVGAVRPARVGMRLRFRHWNTERISALYAAAVSATARHRIGCSRTVASFAEPKRTRRPQVNDDVDAGVEDWLKLVAGCRFSLASRTVAAKESVGDDPMGLVVRGVARSAATRVMVQVGRGSTEVVSPTVPSTVRPTQAH